jgi:hypothetical protein
MTARVADTMVMSKKEVDVVVGAVEVGLEEMVVKSGIVVENLRNSISS